MERKILSNDSELQTNKNLEEEKKIAVNNKVYFIKSLYPAKIHRSSFSNFYKLANYKELSED